MKYASTSLTMIEVKSCGHNKALHVVIHTTNTMLATEIDQHLMLGQRLPIALLKMTRDILLVRHSEWQSLWPLTHNPGMVITWWEELIPLAQTCLHDLITGYLVYVLLGPRVCVKKYKQ
jgi:hypothetical protein